MPAIVTKFLSPTDTKGARVSLSCGTARQTVPRDYEAPASQGVSRATVLAFVETRFPNWSGGELRGPYHLDDQRDVWTYGT